MEKASEHPPRKMVSKLCILFHPFHRQLHSYILCSSTQLITIIIPYSLRYLAPHNSPNSAWHRPKNQEMANWIPRSSPHERTQCRQGSSSYHCSTRGDCSTSWNCRLIDGGKPTGSTSSDVPVPLMIPSLFSPLPQPRSSSTMGIFFGPSRTGKICLSKYTLCCRSSIPTYLFWWCPDEAESRAHRSIYVVSGPGLVQALCKMSTSCIDLVILFSKDDKMTKWYPLKSFRCCSESVRFVRQSIWLREGRR